MTHPPRHGFAAFTLIALLLSLTHPDITRADAGSRPNIIFILADDLGYGDLGCYGQRRIRTPNIDRMAAEGIRFTQAYAGATVCAPSRCVLMTGRHVGHARVRGNAGQNNPLAQTLRPDDFTVARGLQQAGYRTGLVGKWGLGDVGPAEVGLPRKHGFDHFFGYLNQHHAHNYYPTYLWRNETRIELANVLEKSFPTGAGVASIRKDYSHDLFTDEALQFVRENASRPFFLYLALTIPHANNEAGRLGMEVPQLNPYDELDWPDPVKGHAAMITRMDAGIGRLFHLLQELDIDRRTLVVFTSDNGPHREGGFDPAFNRSSGPLRGIKRDHYDGGIRVPAIVRWPGRVPAGRVSPAVWYFADVLPTLATLAGAPVPLGIDGLNVLPSWLGETQPELGERLLYWEFHEGGFKQAARWRDWKIIRNRPNSPAELYNIVNDPAEAHDLALILPELARSLGERLATERTDSPDWPAPTPP